MAQRRMFSLKIIDTDLFLDMPVTARLLYYDLSMRADDDGFVASPKKIQRMVGSSDDDLRLLVAKQFIIPFDTGVCVIKHWRVHNYIRSDRYTETLYTNEKQALMLDDNGKYELNVIPNGNQMSYQMDTQVRLGKDRLELGKDRLLLDTSNEDCSNKLQPIMDHWNSLNLSQIKSIKGNRLKLLNTRIKEYSIDEVIQAIDSISKSSFLKGQNNRNWIVTFDWFIKPNNFPKVLEGNYLDKEVSNGNTGQNNATSKSEYETLDFSKFEG
ncbi:hypothetical protein UT300016_09720 [Clostridium senegalense]